MSFDFKTFNIFDFNYFCYADKRGEEVLMSELRTLPSSARPDQEAIPPMTTKVEKASAKKAQSEEEEQRQRLLYVRGREPLSTLVEEFKHSPVHKQKIQECIDHGYVAWRRVRGDGNCCYRAVGYGLLEQIIAAPRGLREAWASDLLERLRTVKLQEPAEAAAHADLLQRVMRMRTTGMWDKDEPPSIQSPQSSVRSDAVRCPRSPLQQLHANMSSPSNTTDQAMIRALRLLVARFLIDNAENQDTCELTFNLVVQIEGYEDIKDFNNKVVLPMGNEAQSVVLPALPKALGIDVTIALIDTTIGPLCLQECEAMPRKGPGLVRPKVHVQLRPGHYDLMYFQEEDEFITEALKNQPPTLATDGVEMWKADLAGVEEAPPRKWRKDAVWPKFKEQAQAAAEDEEAASKKATGKKVEKPPSKAVERRRENKNVWCL